MITYQSTHMQCSAFYLHARGVKYSGFTPSIVANEHPVTEFLPLGFFHSGLCSGPSLSLLVHWIVWGRDYIITSLNC